MATSTAPAGFGRPIWSAVKNARGTHGTGYIPLSTVVKGENATISKEIFLSLPPTAGYVRVVAATITPITATIAGHGSNFWSFKLQVGSDDLGTSALTTEGATPANDLTLDTSYDLDVQGPDSATPKKVFLAGDDSLKLTMTKAASAANQADNYFRVVLWLLISPPR